MNIEVVICGRSGGGALLVEKALRSAEPFTKKSRRNKTDA